MCAMNLCGSAFLCGVPPSAWHRSIGQFRTPPATPWPRATSRRASAARHRWGAAMQHAEQPAHLSCSVCLDELKEPALPCGHGVCMDCLTGWIKESGRGVTRGGASTTCPVCRQPARIAPRAPTPEFEEGAAVEALWKGKWCPGVVDEVIVEPDGVHYEVAWTEDEGFQDKIRAVDIFGKKLVRPASVEATDLEPPAAPSPAKAPHVELESDDEDGVVALEPASAPESTSAATMSGRGALFDRRELTRMTTSEKTGRWTDDEHARFLRGLEVFGKKWTKVADIVGSRTTVQVRSHAQKHFKKLAKARPAPAEARAGAAPPAAPRRLRPIFFELLEVFLGVGSDLYRRSRADDVRDLRPLLAEELQAVEEARVLLVGPSTRFLARRGRRGWGRDLGGRWGLAHSGCCCRPVALRLFLGGPGRCFFPAAPSADG